MAEQVRASCDVWASPIFSVRGGQEVRVGALETLIYAYGGPIIGGCTNAFEHEDRWLAEEADRG